MHHRLRTLCLSISIALAVGAASAGPLDAATATRIESDFRAWFNATPRAEAMQSAEAEVERRLAGVTVSELDAASIETLVPMLQFSGPMMADALNRLRELSKLDSADGAIASTTLAVTELVRTRRPLPVAQVFRVLEHPGLPAALRDGWATSVFELAMTAQPEQLRPVRGRLTELGALYAADDLNSRLLLTGPAYLALMRATADGPEEAAGVVELKEQIVAAARTELARLEDKASATRDEIALMVAGLDGAFVRGELLGYQAPEIDFLWSSVDELPETLGALKGRVVVLDFWATWCMPCIAAFPRIRELTEHYEDKPVTVLGVTHLQGYHIGGDREQTLTAGDPALEYRLMDDYVGELDITWPIVFSTEAVWLEYGVQGIPHVAIVGKDGKVRHRGLSPFMPKAEKYALIDALLAEPDPADG